ncbi:hypothetical protein [Gilliamella apicola]|uniref:Uncharacterized protein n=1 Tax=Gilliamella apicola TaxID=1196095 RepID=A0A2V4DYG7_9GAMM|nr:hypothetical protein [Gilliamella apicola]PXZ03951.1 hypothetical protein DKK79_06100 [Gilliamella apicola]
MSLIPQYLFLLFAISAIFIAEMEQLFINNVIYLASRKLAYLFSVNRDELICNESDFTQP